MIKDFCFINGRKISVRDATIGVTDLGLQRGYGIFDYVRTYNGKLFHFEGHLARLHRSAAALHLELPATDAEIMKQAARLIDDSEFTNPSIRLILTGGNSHSLLTFEDPNFLVIAEELPNYPPGIYTRGASLITDHYQRELPGIKSINYLNALRLDPLKQEKGAIDILYHWQNEISECSHNNFFVFQQDTLVTPGDNILGGITRNIILQLANKYFRIEERTLKFSELPSVNEAFITSTSRGVVPIVQIDEWTIGNGAVGEHTKMLMSLFDQYTLAY